MQTNNKQLYKLTAERTGKPEKQYKEVGEFVFNKLRNNLRRPDAILQRLRGVGTWFLRRKRMDIAVNVFTPNLDWKPKEGEYFLSVIANENKLEIYNLFKERLKDYEEYLKIKEEIRKIRNESQTLLQPPEGEN